MGRGLTPPVRAWLATLCVALSVVFAGSSAASVVDRVQHAAQAPHEHTVQLTLTAADDDHHADHQDDGDRDASEQAPNDHQTGPGHHHADGPTGSLGGADEPFAAVSIGLVSLPNPDATGARGIRPGGLERPPKVVATRV